jgi:hypothetical protein
LWSGSRVSSTWVSTSPTMSWRGQIEKIWHGSPDPQNILQLHH